VSASAPAGRQCGLLWFLHISKTAGSSYHAYLQHKFENYELDELWQFWSPTKPHPHLLFETTLKPKMDQLAANPRGRLVAVHHHHGAPGMHILMPVLQAYRQRLEAKGCNLFLATVVRSPDGWIESMMSYNLVPGDLASASNTEDVWRTMLRTKEYDNGEIRYILNNYAPTVHETYPMAYGAVDAAATDRTFEILQGFDAVGFTETFDEFVRKVDTLVGFTHTGVPFVNKTPRQKSSALARMPGDIMTLAHQRTAQDWELYTRLRESEATAVRAQHVLTQGARKAPRPPTAFCFMVIRPNSYEERLLQTAMTDGGFPACTAFRVYSNLSTVAKQPAFAAIKGSIDVPFGGEYNCALNTGIFIQVYRAMFAEGEYRKYDWVVKIDPDTVINDVVLQRVLERQPAPPGPLVLNNAEPSTVQHFGPLGLKGALIAVTSDAMALYAQNPAVCEKGVDWKDKSEDWYLGICLIEMLKAPVRFEPQLVKYLGLGGSALCADDPHAVFHPLKSPEQFTVCKRNLHVPPGPPLRDQKKPALLSQRL
jgi:hypothetical protein